MEQTCYVVVEIKTGKFESEYIEKGYGQSHIGASDMQVKG